MGGRGVDGSRRGWGSEGGRVIAAGARAGQSGEAKLEGSVKGQVGEAHLRVKREPWRVLSWVEGWEARWCRSGFGVKGG